MYLQWTVVDDIEVYVDGVVEFLLQKGVLWQATMRMTFVRTRNRRAEELERCVLGMCEKVGEGIRNDISIVSFCSWVEAMDLIDALALSCNALLRL